jgi:hypothetical protein
MSAAPESAQRPGSAPHVVADPSQAILEATKQVAGVLKAGGFRFALVGSVAAYAHGVARRPPHDTDFGILREDVDRVLDALAQAGLTVWRPPEDWLVKAEFRDQTVDLIIALSDQPVTAELLARAETLPVDSVWMPVLSPTDLMISQLRSFSEHHCDFGTALPIARTLRERIDWGRVRCECGALPMGDAFLFLLERLQVIPSRKPAAPGETGETGETVGGNR